MKKFKKIIEEVFILVLSCFCMLSLFLTIYLWTRAMTYRNGEKIKMYEKEKSETTISRKPVIKFEKLNPDAQIPTRADDGSACYDLYSSDTVTISPHSRALVRTGLKWEPPSDVEMQIRPRSGLALKHGITVLNTPGTVDSSYRGEIGVILFNTSDESYEVKTGDRIAQAKFSRVHQFDLYVVDSVNETERGNGGFGHSGR